MFNHNFFYTLKTLFRNKMLIFWTFAFPLILGTFFNMAFSNIEESEKLDIIDIAIVQNNYFEQKETFKKAFEALGDETSEDQLFSIKYTSEGDAIELLEDNKISGYLIFTPEVKIVVNKNGIESTILKQVTDEIGEKETIYRNMIAKKLESGTIAFTPEEDPETFYASLVGEIDALVRDSAANIKDNSKENLSYTMIEFYTLIALTCLYGGIIGMTAINQHLANMSKKGMRTAIGPTPKWKLVLSSALASYVVEIIGLAILFAYTIFALKVDYGTNFKEIVFLSLLGCLAGLTFGLMVASLFKTDENVKTGIVISVTMLGSFLSGMMGITMKYIVDKGLPLLNLINPANMITDGLYALYYYGVGERFYLNVISLIAFSSIMILLSIISLRRQKYDSI